MRCYGERTALTNLFAQRIARWAWSWRGRRCRLSSRTERLQFGGSAERGLSVKLYAARNEIQGAHCTMYLYRPCAKRTVGAKHRVPPYLRNAECSDAIYRTPPTRPIARTRREAAP